MWSERRKKAGTPESILQDCVLVFAIFVGVRRSCCPFRSLRVEQKPWLLVTDVFKGTKFNAIESEMLRYPLKDRLPLPSAGKKRDILQLQMAEGAEKGKCGEQVCTTCGEGQVKAPHLLEGRSRREEMFRHLHAFKHVGLVGGMWTIFKVAIHVRAGLVGRRILAKNEIEFLEARGLLEAVR